MDEPTSTFNRCAWFCGCATRLAPCVLVLGSLVGVRRPFLPFLIPNRSPHGVTPGSYACDGGMRATRLAPWVDVPDFNLRMVHSTAVTNHAS